MNNINSFELIIPFAFDVSADKSNWLQEIINQVHPKYPDDAEDICMHIEDYLCSAISGIDMSEMDDELWYDCMEWLKDELKRRRWKNILLKNI